MKNICKSYIFNFCILQSMRFQIYNCNIEISTYKIDSINFSSKSKRQTWKQIIWHKLLIKKFL